jgi:transcriptional regulator with XRE-family HTH domain
MTQQPNRNKNHLQDLAITRTIGQRLKQARELNNLNLFDASIKLGYSNSSKLSKIENAQSANTVPIWLINKAASLYQVTIDWIFGRSSDWELSAYACDSREQQSFIADMLNQARARDLEVLHRINNRAVVVGKSTNELIEAIEKINTALDSFSNLHPEFEDSMRSSRLINDIKRAARASTDAKVRLAQLRMPLVEQVGIKSMAQEALTFE